ncbi:MAG: phosphopantetheine-binding protein, partial [Rhodobacteraceae bacterium]|nr:phosphopantetheine-binding protein [Paracoccaceae bacterium]
ALHFYRTGDYACWSQAGQMQFIGRRDSEIKIRGFRVNLAEISRQLRQDTRVSQAVAAQKAGQLVGYIVPAAEVQDQLRTGSLKPQKLARQLSAALRKSLPQFMRPTALLVLEALPLTAQGKVDLTALPLPIEEQSGFCPPETATEKTVAAIWAEYLERPQISVKDSFFTIGGHSLLAIRIISRLGQEFGVVLKLEDFFNAFTIRSLAQLIDTLVGIDSDATPTGPVVEEGEI